MGIFFEDFVGEFTGLADECGVCHEVEEAEIEDAGLGGAEEVSGATECEICLGNSEAVGGGGKGFEFFDGVGLF